MTNTDKIGSTGVEAVSTAVMSVTEYRNHKSMIEWENALQPDVARATCHVPDCDFRISNFVWQPVAIEKDKPFIVLFFTFYTLINNNLFIFTRPYLHCCNPNVVHNPTGMEKTAREKNQSP